MTARALGPDGKGVVAAVLAWPQLFGWVLLLGLGTATSLRVAESPETAPHDALGNALVYCLSVGLIGTVAGLAFLPGALAHLGPSASAATHIAVFAIPIGMLRRGLDGNQPLVRAGAPIQLGAHRWRSHCPRAQFGPRDRRGGEPLTVVGAALVGGLFTLAIAAGGLPWRQLTVVLQRLRRDLAYGLRVFLTSLLGLVNLRLDILLMTAFLAASQIGWYTVAVNAMLPITIVTTTVVTLILPTIGRVRGARGSELGGSSANR